MARSTTEDDLRHIPYLLISQKTLHYHSPYGVVSRIQVSVQYNTYTVHVMMRIWKKEAFENIEDLADICKMIGNNTKHKFCPGIEMNHYMDEYHNYIWYHIKSVQLIEFPFHQIDLQSC